MMTTIFANKKGIVSDLFEKIITPASKKFKAKIALVGIGFEEHFDWDAILKSYTIAKEKLSTALPKESFEVIYSDEPIQTKQDMLAWLEKMKHQNVNGIIIYQASYIAGDLASTTAHWFTQNPIPVLSWSHDEATGGRLSNNRLCGQNFLLNIFTSNNVKYTWLFESPESKTIIEHIMPFAKAVYAKASINQQTLCMVGGFRVPGFYDCELNEMEILKRYGLLVDRVDFQTIFKHGERFSDDQITEIKNTILTHPECKYNNVPDSELLLGIRLALSVADYTRINNYIGVGLKNWPELFDHYGIAGDGAGALIQDIGIPVSDESDMGALLTMVVMNQLSLEQCVPTLMDMSLLDEENNHIGYWHCGGASTKLMKKDAGFEVRKHSILENYSEDETMGPLFEFLHELGDITIAKYMYPDAARIMTFEAEVIESKMAFRGSYAEVKPKKYSAVDIASTVLNNGCDHHWILGRGKMLAEINEFNHWLEIQKIPIEKSNDYLFGHSK